jgi:O-succinylbenzoate synthase
MKYRFEFRRYRVPFRGAVRTGHGVWAEREGVIVRISTESGASALGEAAPVPGFGMESVDDVVAACAQLGEWVDSERLAELPPQLPTLRHAVATARAGLVQLEKSDTTEAQANAAAGSAALGVAALLPAGRAVLAALPPKAEAGFRIFKWKVGVGDLADELALLDDVCAALPNGAKLRLDANGAWDRRQAERWFERCADRPVEFVEQPCFAPGGATQGAALLGGAGAMSREGRKAEDLLRGLAESFPTVIALDESIVGEGDVERWLGVGWRGVFVVKPALFGDVAATLAKLERAKADVVFSSALETAVGAQSALRAAFAWNASREGAQRRALGFGVWPLFADARFDGPHAAPFIRASDVERMDVGSVWAALNE